MVCVEKCEIYGGICFNVGCIFLKVLLYVFEVYYEICNGIFKFGVKVYGVDFDLFLMM